MPEHNQELLESIDSRLRELENKFGARDEVDKELLDLFHAVKGSLTVLRGIERISIWLAKMSAAAGILWFLFSHAVQEAIKNITRGGN